MQKVTKKIKAAAIAPRAQPCQRTGEQQEGVGLFFIGVDDLMVVWVWGWRALVVRFWSRGWGRLKALGEGVVVDGGNA